MALIQCRQCEKVFDSDLIPPGAPLLCVYCGADNGGARDAVSPAGLPPPLPTASDFSGGSGSVPPSERPRCEWEVNWKTNPVGAYVNTFREVITSPVKYFGTIRPFDDYVSLTALMYVNSFIAVVSALIFQFLVGFAPLLFTQKFDEMALGATMGLGFGLCFAFVAPLFTVLGLILGAGIMHFFLRVIGGTQKNFDTTFTVYGLSTMANVFGIVPFLGNFAVMIYSFIINIGGQAEAHEIPPLKAFLAFILPTLICCCCFVGLAAAIPAFITALEQAAP